MASHRRPDPGRPSPDDPGWHEHAGADRDAGHDPDHETEHDPDHETGHDPDRAFDPETDHDGDLPDPGHHEFAGGLFHHDHEPGDGREPLRRRSRVRRGIGKTLWTLVAVVVLAGITIGVVAGVRVWQHSNQEPTDFTGVGEMIAVVRVQSGDGLLDVGKTLVKAGAVANASTFVEVAKDSGKLAGLQPGFYAVHLHSSSRSVVGELADPKNRLGQLRIIPGQTLADVTVVTTSGEKSTRQGILSKIADACVPTSGEKSCFSVEDLWKVEKTATPAELGVVGWAVDAVDDAPEPARRLEGLILPGDYDIAPGSTAKEALTAVLSASAARWNTTNIVAGAKALGFTPYQLATIASLVQAEAIGGDMPKVARVIDNRLADGMKLQFDSTVNYGLDRRQISTTEAERLDPSNIYSTYAHAGLPPTPIGAPGPKAVDAAESPAIGDWLFFVTVDLDGHTCFSVTPEQHQACVEKARANGVFG